MKVWIIDDEAKLRTLMARVVQMEGFEAFIAEDAKTALKLLAKQEVQIVLCDVRLPTQPNTMKWFSEQNFRRPFYFYAVLLGIYFHFGKDYFCIYLFISALHFGIDCVVYV